MTDLPPLESLLPQLNSLPPSRLLALARADQVRRWHAGQQVRAESYLTGLPSLSEEDALVLIVGEIHLRQQFGQQPILADYQRRFPHLADALAAQFALQSVLDSLVDQPSDPPPSSQPLDSATTPTIPGYDLQTPIGRGGAGVVYRARHLGLGRTVALKILVGGPFASPLQRGRFFREAELLARLRHPHIVQIHDVGETAGCPWLALELIDGPPLSDLAGGPVQPITRLIARIAQALDTAHAAGILHRDLKPANILLRHTPGELDGYSPLLVDFGLARSLDTVDLTPSGDLLGTPCYLAPEQICGRPAALSPATDVYGLGAVLYQLLTGKPPLERPSIAETLLAVLAEHPDPVRVLRSDVPRDLETICHKCLEKNPGDRYPTAAALADDLDRFMAGRPIRARPVSAAERLWRATRRHPAFAGMVAAVVLLSLSLAAGAWAWAWQLSEALSQTRQAERQTRLQLFEAVLSEARATRRARRQGQRFETLRLVRQATALARELELPSERFAELRNVAIAALALPDMVPDHSWAGFPEGSYHYDFDASLTLYARQDKQGNCTIRRVADDAVLHQLPGLGPSPFSPNQSPGLSPDGRFVALFQSDYRMQLWNLANTERPWLDEASVTWFAFRHRPSEATSEIVVSYRNGEIRRFDLRTKRLLRQLPPMRCPTGRTRTLILAVHPEKPIVATWPYFPPAMVQLRHLDTGEALASWPEPAGGGIHDGGCWSPDGQTLLIVPLDGKARVLHGETLQPLREYPCQMGQMRFAQQGARLLRGGDTAVPYQLLDGHTGQLLFRTTAINPGRVRLSPDESRVAASAEDGRLTIWKVAYGGECRLLTLPPDVGKSIANTRYHASTFDSHGRVLIGAMSNGIGFWDLATGRLLETIAGDEKLEGGGVLRVGQSLHYGTSDGLMRRPIREVDQDSPLLHIGKAQRVASVPASGVSGNTGGTVLAVNMVSARIRLDMAGSWLVRPAEGKEVRLEQTWNCQRPAVSRDGRWILTPHRHSPTTVWDANTGRRVRTLPGIGNPALAFSPDGRWLATGEKKGQLWRLGSGHPDEWESGPSLGFDPVGVAFSPDSRVLAVTERDGTIRLLNPETAKEFARLEDPDGESGGGGFSPDGRVLVVVQGLRGFRVWDLERIGEQLTELGLPWSLPSSPSRTRPAGPVRVRVD